MKIKLLHISILFLLVTAVSNAQFQRTGLDRQISNPTPQAQAPSKIEPVDHVQVYSDQITKQLALDGFQAAIIKNIVKDYVNQTTNINVEPIPSEAKYEKIQVAVEKMEKDILEVLNAQQKIKFQELKDQKNKKGKKGKKSKKKNDDPDPSAPMENDGL